jgi:DNA-binding transcriptional ArsR family regulator
VTRGTEVDAPPNLISATLAKALANPWRNRILMELHLRPMSSKQFTEEFGGSLSSIARFFRELREWGFLEVAEELRGGSRRGAVEKVYRAIQRVHFDTSTWEELPRYLRGECSAAVLEGLLFRISQALRAGTFDSEKDRHLSWKALRLDRIAWTTYVGLMDETLAWLNDLEAESAARIAEADEPALPATVALLTFRSPSESRTAAGFEPGRGVKSGIGPAGPPFLMSAQMAKVLANPWRNRILMELHLHSMSPKQFVEEFGGPDLATVARYFRQLKAGGYLEVVQELRGGQRRGAVEKVYRAVRRAHFDTSTWELLPQNLRSECSGSVLDGLILRICQAVEADTFDAEVNRHLSWKAISLDRQGWTECVSHLDGLLAIVDELELQSAKRLEKAFGESIPATIALMAFRSPETSFVRP